MPIQPSAGTKFNARSMPSPLVPPSIAIRSPARSIFRYPHTFDLELKHG
ncbi:hypothetical protein RB10021 [Rhodopirellula baltica SH 1]|uniref:Uncharacterized protein n=1 Tax=Rhodopirellula baltica (strain DSM 10527 / NCIMB 13988 / SH1) TaxID=243090 RepID=Q7UKQ1_RHOBA|nr:hypothetical protein RB10021 [Rhodopirellula baltica SH 1]